MNSMVIQAAVLVTYGIIYYPVGNGLDKTEYATARQALFTQKASPRSNQYPVSSLIYEAV